MEHPTNSFNDIVQLITTLNTEEKCLEFLVNVRWSNTPTCPREGCWSHQGAYYLKERKVYKCKNCGKQYSVKQGTIFHSSKLPLVTWFLAIYSFAIETRGISSCQLAKNIGVTQRTAWTMLQKIRVLMSEENENTILSGVVEADEAYCGATKGRDKRLSAKIYNAKKKRIEMDAEGPKEKKRRIEKEQKYFKKTGKELYGATNKIEELKNSERFSMATASLSDKETRMIRYQPVHYRKNIFGMVERDTPDADGNKIPGRLILRTVGRHGGDVRADNLLPIFQKHVRWDTHIMTDELSGYNCLSEHFKKHSTIKHSSDNGEPVEYTKGDVTTNHIENVWNQFKKVENGTYVHYSWKYTDRYLAEFVFRWNFRENKNGVVFNELLSRCLLKPIPNSELVDVDASYIYYAA